MANEENNEKTKADFQRGHRQNNFHGKVENFKPDGSGELEKRKPEGERDEQVKDAVDDILNEDKGG